MCVCACVSVYVSVCACNFCAHVCLGYSCHLKSGWIALSYEEASVCVYERVNVW